MSLVCISQAVFGFLSPFSVPGISGDISKIDNMPYTTLMFTNGPGYNYTTDGSRVGSVYSLRRQFEAEI